MFGIALEGEGKKKSQTLRHSCWKACRCKDDSDKTWLVFDTVIKLYSVDIKEWYNFSQGSCQPRPDSGRIQAPSAMDYEAYEPLVGTRLLPHFFLGKWMHSQSPPVGNNPFILFIMIARLRLRCLSYHTNNTLILHVIAALGIVACFFTVWNILIHFITVFAFWGSPEQSQNIAHDT